MATLTTLDKLYLEQWKGIAESFSGLSIDKNESFTTKQKRIRKLEETPEKWFKYYFANYYTSEPAGFHTVATLRVLTHPEWYEVRAWSRELSKSARTMMEVCYLALTEKKKNVLLVSNSNDNATRLLAPYKAFFECNLRVINDYGEQKNFGDWEASEFTIKKGCAFRALGWGQSPRGTRKENVRPDVILIDDIDTDEECRNPEIMDNKVNWIEQALIGTRSISNPLLIIVCGNIIHNNCTITRLAEKSDHFEIINIRDEKGRSTWKEKNTEEMIDRVLGSISYDSGQKEYFNNPMDGTDVFKNLLDKKIPNLSECLLLIYGDPSTSNRDKGENNNKAVVLLALQGLEVYIVKVFMDIPTNAKFIDAYFELYRLAKEFKDDVFVYIENNSLQNPFYEQVFLPLVYQKGNEYKLFLPLTPDERKKGEKFTRIEARLEPLDRLGHLFFNKEEADNKNMQALKAQFKAFNRKLKKMDGIDAVEGGVGILQEKEANRQTGGIENFPELILKKYKMLVSVEELGQTSLYPEIIKRITRDQPGNAELQILAAESLVKSYMSKYDLKAIFGTETDPPSFIDEHIKKLVKTIASYYLVKLNNPNVNIELYRADYEDCLTWLERLQDGKVNPILPYAPENEENTITGEVWWDSNPKRTNYF